MWRDPNLLDQIDRRIPDLGSWRMATEPLRANENRTMPAGSVFVVYGILATQDPEGPRDETARLLVGARICWEGEIAKLSMLSRRILESTPVPLDRMTEVARSLDAVDTALVRLGKGSDPAALDTGALALDRLAEALRKAQAAWGEHLAELLCPWGAASPPILIKGNERFALQTSNSASRAQAELWGLKRVPVV